MGLHDSHLVTFLAFPCDNIVTQLEPQSNMTYEDIFHVNSVHNHFNKTQYFDSEKYFILWTKYHTKTSYIMNQFQYIYLELQWLIILLEEKPKFLRHFLNIN